MVSRASLTLTFFLFSTLLIFGVVHAESVQWSTAVSEPGVWGYADRNYGDTSWPGQDPYEYDFITNPNVSITYRASVTNLDTNTPVLCDGSSVVPAGASLKFMFEPHVYQDIYWFSSGGAFDSPYGDWIAGAAKPYGNMCVNLPEKDFVSTHSINQGYPDQPQVTGDIYVSLSVDPPTKSLDISGSVSGCTTVDSNGSKTCTASAPGSIASTFAPTSGKFYGRNKIQGGQCYTSNAAMWGRDYDGAQWWPFTLSVPERSLSCPITVVEEVGNPPANPSISASAACVVGSPHSLTFTAADSDGDQIRYGVDWDANGTIDQFVPASGYVSSGTAQTASRTYATEGAKTVKVLAQDENGLTSGWSSYTFSCSQSESQSGEGENLGEQGGAGGDSGISPNLTIRAIPSFVQTGETTKLHWSASNVTACTVTGSNGDSFEGTISPEPEGQQTSAIQEQTTYTLSCEDEDGNILTQSATVSVNPIWSEPGLN